MLLGTINLNEQTAELVTLADRSIQTTALNSRTEHQISEELSTKILAVIREQDIDAFAAMIKQMDCNHYANIEGTEVLFSAFLLGQFINPDFANGDEWIRVVLAEKPNLELPVLKNDDSLSFKKRLLDMQSEFAERLNQSPDESAYINAAISRISIILNKETI